MSKLQLAAFGVLVAAAAVSHPADAQTINQSRATMAAGACQPFVPTTQVRFNASGISNAGTTPIYVVCSIMGSENHFEGTNGNGGALQIILAVGNSTNTLQSITCSARPGLIVGSYNEQLVLTKVESIPARNDAGGFIWKASEFSMAGLASPNFTCALNPGMTINYISTTYAEPI